MFPVEMRPLYVDTLSDHTLTRITDYLAGELSDAEVIEFERELGGAPPLRQKIQTLQRAFGEIPRRHVPDIENAIIANVHAVAIEADTRPAMRSARRFSLRRNVWISIAVGMLILFGGYSTWHSRTSFMPKISKSVVFNDSWEYRVYSTAPGQRATIELDDGTRVTLNVASQLEVLRGFGAINRSIRLTGQAQFEVAHSANLPFIVMASGTQMTVLGTTFGVRAYDANIQVVVKSGRVAVAPCKATPMPTCLQSASSTILNPTEMAEIAPNGAIHTKTQSNVDDAFAFVNGRFILPGKPLHAMIDDLNRWYDVQIQLMDPSIGDQPLKGELLPGTWRDLVKMLELTLHVHTQQDGRILRVFR